MKQSQLILYEALKQEDKEGTLNSRIVFSPDHYIWQHSSVLICNIRKLSIYQGKFNEINHSTSL